MKAAAIYARVSTSDQVKGTSLDSQVEACQQYAAANGYSILQVVREDASGARLGRPGLDSVRDMAAEGLIQAVIIFDPDRLARNLGHLMLLTEELERRRVELVFVNSSHDTTPEGKMMLQMRGMFAEYERAKIMERSRRGKEQSVKNGKVFLSNTEPYGYRYIPGEGRAEIVEEEAVWVAKMFDWLVNEGCTLREITRRLDAAGVVTKKGNTHWSASTVGRILNSPLCAGEYIYNKRISVEPANPRQGTRKCQKSSKAARPPEEWLTAPIPAIVSKELQQAASARLKLNKARSSRHTKYFYMLTGMLVCSRCGYKMHGRMKGPRVRTPGLKREYCCSARMVTQRHLPVSERCQTPSRDADAMERVVWDEILRQVSDESLIMSSLQSRVEARGDERERADRELASIYAVEQGLQRETDKLLDLHMADVIARETLQQRMSGIKKRMEAARNTRQEIEARLQKADAGASQIEGLRELCAKVRVGLPYLTPEDKREFLAALDLRITSDGAYMTITGTLSSAPLAITDKYKPESPGGDPHTGDNLEGEDLAPVLLCPAYQQRYILAGDRQDVCGAAAVESVQDRLGNRCSISCYDAKGEGRLWLRHAALDGSAHIRSYGRHQFHYQVIVLRPCTHHLRIAHVGVDAMVCQITRVVEAIQ